MAALTLISEGDRGTLASSPGGMSSETLAFEPWVPRCPNVGEADMRLWQLAHLLVLQTELGTPQEEMTGISTKSIESPEVTYVSS